MDPASSGDRTDPTGDKPTAPVEPTARPGERHGPSQASVVSMTSAGLRRGVVAPGWPYPVEAASAACHAPGARRSCSVAGTSTARESIEGGEPGSVRGAGHARGRGPRRARRWGGFPPGRRRRAAGSVRVTSWRSRRRRRVVVGGLRCTWVPAAQEFHRIRHRAWSRPANSAM